MRLWTLATGLAVLALIVRTGVGVVRRQQALRRLEDAAARTSAAPPELTGVARRLADWLAQSGYRSPRAPQLFLAATVAGALAGFVLGQAYSLTVRRTLVEQVTVLPGTTGEVLAELLSSGSLILVVIGACLPWSVVRTARRTRVRAIEQDLPLALEMLSMMAEAGLGFDAAVGQIVKARGSERPLAAEFLKFQLDMVAGMPRAQALRQLARRVHLPALTSFTSALIQAEQIGASVAETLQLQAGDMRQRRREEALLRAQALPVKLVFPLVICFLPGVFLSTLAPVLFQMLQVANGVLRSGQ